GKGEGLLAGARPPPYRQVRAVLGWHAVPRRDRRHAASHPGQDAARAPGADVRARRGQRNDPHRRAADRGDPPRPEGVVRRGEVPTRPVLPARRLHHPPAPLAGAWRRPVAAGAALCASFQPRVGARSQAGGSGGDGTPVPLSLARQHPGVAERPQTSLAPGRWDGFVSRFSARISRWTWRGLPCGDRERARLGNVCRPSTARIGCPRPARRSTPGIGPAVVAPRSCIHRGERPTGRADPRDGPTDASHEAPGARAVRQARRGPRKRRAGRLKRAGTRASLPDWSPGTQVVDLTARRGKAAIGFTSVPSSEPPPGRLFRSFPMPDQATIPAENSRKKCLQVILRFAAPPENSALLALAWWLRNPSQEADRRMEGLNRRGAAFLQCGVSRIDRP